MTFSWEQVLLDAIDEKISRSRTLAKSQNPDYKLSHPDECKDAEINNYVKLDARVKKDVQTRQKQNLDRRLKLVTK